MKRIRILRQLKPLAKKPRWKLIGQRLVMLFALRLPQGHTGCCDAFLDTVGVPFDCDRGMHLAVLCIRQ